MAEKPFRDACGLQNDVRLVGEAHTIMVIVYYVAMDVAFMSTWNMLREGKGAVIKVKQA